MKKPARSSILSVVFVAVFGAAATDVPLDLSTWTVVQYEFNDQPDAQWSLSAGNTVAYQSVNADASIFLGDFNSVNREIRGTWRVNTTGDDDYMGFVFGYQGRGQYYLFDWKQSDQNDPLGFAERGMSIKVVSVPGGADPTGSDLWPSAGSSRVSVLRHNTISWSDFVDYGFQLSFLPGQFRVQVSEGGVPLEDWTVNDATYTSGPFGFYNYSQGDVEYRGFTQAVIPEPRSALAAGVLLLGVGGLARLGISRRTRANCPRC